MIHIPTATWKSVHSLVLIALTSRPRVSKLCTGSRHPSHHRATITATFDLFFATNHGLQTMIVQCTHHTSDQCTTCYSMCTTFIFLEVKKEAAILSSVCICVRPCILSSVKEHPGPNACRFLGILKVRGVFLRVKKFGDS